MLVQVQVKVLQGRLRRGRGVGVAMVQGVLDVKKISAEDGTTVDRLCAGEKGTVQLVDRSALPYLVTRMTLSCTFTWNDISID